MSSPAWFAGARRAAAGIAIAVSFTLAGCVLPGDLKSHELIGAARAPISPDAVQLFLEPPSRRYERIAVLRSSSRRSWSFASQAKAEVVIRRLKEEAASLGANGILLDEIADRPGASLGAVVGGTYMGPRGTADLGIGVSTLTLQRYGSGIAIYLAP